MLDKKQIKVEERGGSVDLKVLNDVDGEKMRGKMKKKKQDFSSLASFQAGSDVIVLSKTKRKIRGNVESMDPVLCSLL